MNNEQQAYQYLIAQGYPPVAAAGIGETGGGARRWPSPHRALHGTGGSAFSQSALLHRRHGVGQ